MAKYKFRAIILFGSGDYTLLKRAVESLYPEIIKYSTEPVPIHILNKSGKVFDFNQIDKSVRYSAYSVFQDFLYPQVLNWAIREAIANEDEFMFQFHDDAMAYPGLMKEMVETYERVKGTNWSAIFGGAGDHCSFYNQKYNQTFDVWYDAFLFPHYFMDNHYFRIATLRGWPIVDTVNKLTLHEGSAGLRNGNFGFKNQMAFPHSATLYASIWGGGPGAETVTDPNARGLA
jgi:hypothetical protein